MRTEEHLKVDRFILGKEYEEVHEWLDGAFWKYRKTPHEHWVERHHIKAITEKYGIHTERYNAAYTHILLDYLTHFGIAYVPVSSKKVETMLKSLGYSKIKGVA